MLARYARRLLLAELALYVLVTLWLRALGFGWSAALVAIACFAVGARAGGVAMTFALAEVLVGPGARPRLPLASRALMIAGETLWTSYAFSVLVPFSRAFGGPDSRFAAVSGVPPVLLVHGYMCNGGIWAPMRRFLEANGVATYTVDLEPPFAGIDEFASALDARIESVCAASGARRLVLVGHSMGGLVARAYLRAKGPGRVAKLATLGTPHQGTRLALFGLGLSARQMQPGSAWLTGLRRAGAYSCAVTAISSVHDNIIVPRDSALLEGAENVRLSAVGHVNLAFARAARQILLKEILACEAG